MFYDLESPLDFMRQIYAVLDNEGIWVFEQSYLPALLAMNAYDTICHEHLECYCLSQIAWMAARVGFKIIDVELNSINGGSFSVTAAKKKSSYRHNASLVHKIVQGEKEDGLDNEEIYKDFSHRVFAHRRQLLSFVHGVKKEGRRLLGYGASTKGNAILQFCRLSARDIPYIAEISRDKFGCYTPGTGIPIISELEAHAMHPDYFLVLPWHFRENIIFREQRYLRRGGRLCFPLPCISLV